MKLTRCIGTLAVAMGLALGVTFGTATQVSALCGDGVTTVGEACDAGTPVCEGGKNVGAECCTDDDCNGGTCTGAGSSNDGVGNRDDEANACRCNCMLPMCGDGVSDNLESCDGGASATANTPCLGDLPNSVCANAATGIAVRQSAVLGNSSAYVGCTTDGDCAINAALTSIAQKCTGNPACTLNQCGDEFLCSDASCTSGKTGLASTLTGGSPGLPGPESCDDGNTSNTDSCLSFNFSASLGGNAVPLACNSNICGDGTTNMGVEQCDAGQALCATGAKVGKTCATDADCKVGDVPGFCTGAGPVAFGLNPSGFDNRNDKQNCLGATGLPTAGGNLTCDNGCTLPFCGDGVSDQLGGDCAVGLNTVTLKNDDEQCDDGTTANGQGQFCNKVRTCMGGENPGDLCTADSDCIKGMCGMTMCVQNACGDGILAGNEQCDDGNLVAASGTSSNGDTCGVGPLVAAGLYAVLGCDSTTTLQNLPDACPAAACVLPFCGDGVTNPGEMCDDGACVCGPASYNPNALCNDASDCKPLVTGTDVCGPSTLDPISCNDDEEEDGCRSNCMPPSCGDGVSDTGEECEPPAAGTFCIKTDGLCVLNVCGDGDVCTTTATDSFGVERHCTTGPEVSVLTGLCTGASVDNNSPELCDDGNTVDPSSTNLDTCSAICCESTCGDGVTNPGTGEQCDSTGMGCSNMQEDLSNPEMAPDCCIDGDVVSGDKVGIVAGLLSVEQGYNSLLDCRLPNLQGAASCDRQLTRTYTNVYNKVLSSQVSFENNDLSKARRLLRQAARTLDRTARRISRVVQPGKACASNGEALANQNANASDITEDIVAELNTNNNHFAP